MTYCNMHNKYIPDEICKDYDFLHKDKPDCVKLDPKECFWCRNSWTNPR